MMKKLILHPTSLSQWHALVNEAEQFCCVELGEEIESYLVFLLIHFSERPEFVKSILALEFLDSLKHTGNKRIDLLKEIGDKCLLFAGLFPEHAHRRRVNSNYFIDLGQNAYYSISNLGHTHIALYQALCDSFSNMSKVLYAMKEENKSKLELFDLIKNKSIH